MKKVRRFRTFAVGDWLPWGLRMVISIAIDAIDILARGGMMLASLGITSFAPDPVNFTLNMIMVGLAKIMWGTGSMVFQGLETALEFVPVVNTVVDFTPVLTLSGLFHLFDEVDPADVTPRKFRSRAELTQLGVTLGSGGLVTLITWRFEILGILGAISAGAAVWAVMAFVFQVDWARVSRPQSWALSVSGLVLVGIMAIPAAYYAQLEAEVLRTAAWNKMVADGMGEYFPTAEDRVAEIGAKAQRGQEIIDNTVNSWLRGQLDELLSFGLGKEITPQETAVDPEVQELDAEILELQAAGAQVENHLDLERYHSRVTWQVADRMRRQRMLGWLLLAGLMALGCMVVILWPLLRQIPLKPEPYRQLTDYERQRFPAERQRQLPRHPDNLLPPPD